MEKTTPLDETALRELSDKLDELHVQFTVQQALIQEIHGKTVGAGLWPRIKRIASWLWRLRKRFRQVRKLRSIAKKVSGKLGGTGAKVAATTVAVSAAAATTYVVATRTREAPPEPRPQGAEHSSGAPSVNPAQAPDEPGSDAGDARPPDAGGADAGSSDASAAGVESRDGGPDDAGPGAAGPGAAQGPGTATANQRASREPASIEQLDDSLQQTRDRRDIPTEPAGASANSTIRLRGQGRTPLAPTSASPRAPRSIIDSSDRAAPTGASDISGAGTIKSEKRVRYGDTTTQRRPIRRGAVRPDSRRITARADDQDGGAAEPSPRDDQDTAERETE